jgi:hypothetical protein
MDDRGELCSGLSLGQRFCHCTLLHLRGARLPLADHYGRLCGSLHALLRPESCLGLTIDEPPPRATASLPTTVPPEKLLVSDLY